MVVNFDFAIFIWYFGATNSTPPRSFMGTVPKVLDREKKMALIFIVISNVFSSVPA